MSTKPKTDPEDERVNEDLSDEELDGVAGGAFVKSWSTSGDADDRPIEEVAFYYNKIAFSYPSTDDGGAK